MKHIAIIGGGISGLAAAYLLSGRHRITLFEQAGRLGGHTNTVVVNGGDAAAALDTGFLVFNPTTYPTLVRLFEELGVETRPSDMSFSVSCAATGLEYSSRGLRGFFADPRNRARAGHYRLFRDIVRFNREAPSVLDQPGAESWTLGEFLAGGRYGDEFVRRYLAPMASAIWSSSLESIDRFPAQTLVRFMHNHGMLSVVRQPKWRVVAGGSHTYIPRIVARLRGAVRLGMQLSAIRRDEHGATVGFAAGGSERVDEVVFACHGDQVLPLLADPSDAEREVFSQFTTTANDTWLHTDAALLPGRSAAQASWNYRLAATDDRAPSLTYDLNRLQSIPGPTRYCVTLNPREPIRPECVIGRFAYRHPRVTLGSVRAQARWAEVSGVNRTHYCGAYWRYGFHEDGMVSAVRVARALGVTW
jgi:predicted NAD/FAD-binding protein